MLEAKSISVTIGRRTLLEDVSLALKPGTVTVLVGPNGAGKSTLLKAMAGEIKPSTGTVRLEGTDIAALPPHALAYRRAVLPQSVEVAFPFTVAEVIGVGLMGRGSRREAARIERLLARVDLPGFSERRFDTLSGGERQRVQLARVLVQLELGTDGGPSYLLLDEPTSSLDLAHQMGVLDIARAHAVAGGGVLAVLHDLNLAAMAADRLVVLAKGRVAAEGRVEEVLTDDVLARVFGISVRVSAVPAGPFILPQTIVRAPPAAAE